MPGSGPPFTGAPATATVHEGDALAEQRQFVGIGISRYHAEIARDRLARPDDL